MPAEPTTWPRKWTLVCKCTLFKIEGDAHLGYPVWSSFQTNIVLLWVWSKTNKSSAMQVTPGIPARTVHMSFWKYSVAEVMPNGSWLKQNRPKGVMKVSRSTDSLSIWICQKSEFLSNVCTPSWAKVCSTHERMWCFLCMSFVRSMQILSLPSDLETTTMSVHQSVGSFIDEITPRSSICFNSASTFHSDESATLLKVVKANCSAFSCRGI